MAITRKTKIMIIEDDRVLLEFYRSLFPRSFILHTFSKPITAIMQYGVSPDYDYVITDLNMAPKTGEGVIYDIKYINPHQKIIVVTGHDPQSLKLPAAFAVQVFQKPQGLKSVVAEILSHHAA